MGKENVYLKVHLTLGPAQSEAMIAVLSEIGFYAFEEQQDGLDAYIAEADYNEAQLTETAHFYFPELYLRKEVERIVEKDWNEEWEKNFESILIGDFCEVRPPFRESTGKTRYEVVVMPRMAFGTAHHATTWMMVEHCGELDFSGKQVLDMGCGTGVLGILTAQLGAEKVTCIDIDAWSTENTAENARLNGVEGLVILEGGADAIPSDDCYDIILANINRNILLTDRDKYLAHLQAGGEIVLSGIYDFDAEKLTNHYLAAGLELIHRAERQEWIRLAFRKSIHTDI